MAGGGFEHLTALYQPGASMFQPNALNISVETRSEIKDATEHFYEVKAELADLLCYYGRKV